MAPGSTVRRQVATRGYIFVPRLLSNESTISAVSQLGTIATLAGLDRVQILCPRKRADAPPNIYSGNFGLDAFPFHTDLAHWSLPPRYLALRCIRGAAEVATRLFDSGGIVHAVGQAALRRALVLPRRPVGGARSLLPLLQRIEGVSLFRWDQIFIGPATRTSRATCEAVSSFLAAAPGEHISLAERGDTLVIDNWRMLHGRTGVLTTALSRRVERVYLVNL